MKQDDLKMVVIGVLFGSSVTIACFTLPPSSYYKIYKDAKKQCEKELPRSEECIIKMVPLNQRR